MSKFRQIFKYALEKHPLVVNSIIYGSLCVSAEFAQQTLTQKLMHNETPKPYDIAVIGRYIIYGTTLAGPILTLWYRFLDKRLPGTSTKIVVKKLLIDQFVFTPQLLVMFFVVMSAMERKTDIFEECRSKFRKTFQSCCIFWLPAQTINFLFIPPIFRVSYIAVCSSIWINYLCWMKRRALL